MITITNKGRTVKLVDDEYNSLAINGRQTLILNKNLTIPAHTHFEFDTKLKIELDAIEDACIISEFIDGEESPIFVVGESFYFGNEKKDVVLTMYNASDEDITLQKGEHIAYIGQFHTCTCQIEGNEHYWIGLHGQQIIYENGDIQIFGDTEKEYNIETVIEDNGNLYIKIPIVKE